MTRTELIDLVVLLIDNNNANQIDYSRMRTVIEEFLDTVFPKDTADNDGRVPYVDGETYTSSDALRVLSGITTAQKLALAGGIPYADYIYNAGAYTGNVNRTLVTKRYVDGLRRVIGTISSPIEIVSQLRVGDVVTLDGDVSHTIVEGDTFLLKSQTDPAENIPYTVGAESAAAADWYDATKNQEIIIEKGPATKASMPAVEEGGDPVVEILMQSGELVIAVADWAGNTLDVATGDLNILANSLILVSPATKSDSDLWATAEVFCASQDVDTLTFSCATVPTADITINVIVL